MKKWIVVILVVLVIGLTHLIMSNGDIGDEYELVIELEDIDQASNTSAQQSVPS